MTDAARGRNITLTSRSRPLTPQDLADFDYIIGMDYENVAAIHRAASHWATSKGTAADYKSKVSTCDSFLSASRAAATVALLHDIECQLHLSAAQYAFLSC